MARNGYAGSNQHVETSQSFAVRAEELPHLALEGVTRDGLLQAAAARRYRKPRKRIVFAVIRLDRAHRKLSSFPQYSSEREIALA
jgi:hypothetical protein